MINNPVKIVLTFLALMIATFVMLGESWGAELKHKEINCLALAIYFEARNQTVSGKIAVANVVLNRLRSEKFPNTICDVVKENRRPGKLHNCQFSFFCDGLSDMPKEKAAWKNSKLIAEIMVENMDTMADITNGALFYHADYTSPWWADAFTETAVVGNHIFYSH